MPEPDLLTLLEFEAWYSEYPRKVGRPAALKAWLKLAPTPEQQAQMLDVLARQKASPQWQKDGGIYVPHPSTYLHQRRFEDGDVPETTAPACPHDPPCRQYLVCIHRQLADRRAEREATCPA